MRTTGRPSLLARDFSQDVGDPQSSSLSDDQLAIVHVAMRLDEMFRRRALPPADRNLLQALVAEVHHTRTRNDTARYYRSTQLLDERVREVRVRHRAGAKTPNDAAWFRDEDVLRLLLELDDILKAPGPLGRLGLFDALYDGHLDAVKALLANLRPTEQLRFAKTMRSKPFYGPAGVLARLAKLAGSRESVASLTKRFDSGTTKHR